MKQDFIRPVYLDDFVAVIANKSKQEPGGDVAVTALGKGQL